MASLRVQGGAQLSWHADGRSVLTSGRIDDRFGVWRIPVDGGEPMRLALAFDDVTEVRASEDGRRIAFTRRAQDDREVWEYRAK